MILAQRATASILHADLDSFYASVEQRDDPHLRGKPVLVGGGVVLAASYEAKAFGVRSAMGIRQALRRCPGAIVVDARIDAYVEASRAVFEVFDDTTPIVEGISIDEAFLDVAGLARVSGTPTQIARRLRREVRGRVDLPITVGVATTKHLAKVASRVAKPDGLLVVDAGEEAGFLQPLPIELLWGVGPVTSATLRRHGLTRAGEIAQLDRAALVAMVGAAAGHHLHALAHNRDPRHVDAGRRRRSIGAQRALGWRGADAPTVDASLLGLVDRVGRRMRRAHRTGRTVVLRLRFTDMARATRSHTLPRATSHTETLLLAARSLLQGARPLIADRGLTAIGVAVTNLDDDGAVQLELPFRRSTGSTVDAAVDTIRDRFGSGAVTRARLLGRDPGIAVPLLPD